MFPNVGIGFPTIEEVSMPEVWGDASYGGSIVTPYGGGFIRWRNAAVAWIPRKLKFIPLSTCEAEVAAMVNPQGGYVCCTGFA